MLGVDHVDCVVTFWLVPSDIDAVAENDALAPIALRLPVTATLATDAVVGAVGVVVVSLVPHAHALIIATRTALTLSVHRVIMPLSCREQLRILSRHAELLIFLADLSLG